MRPNDLTHAIIGAAIEVHRELGPGKPEAAYERALARELGPGLLASAYEACLCRELHPRGVPFERKVPLALNHKGAALRESDEVQLLVGGRVIVNPCTLAEVEPVHEAQMLSQLRLGRWKLGLLVNFNTVVLRDGLRRIVLSRIGNQPSQIVR